MTRLSTRFFAIHPGALVSAFADCFFCLPTVDLPVSLPLRHGSLETGTNMLLDHAPLQLSEGASHREHGAACRCGRIDALLVKVQVNPLLNGLTSRTDAGVQGDPLPVQAIRSGRSCSMTNFPLLMLCSLSS